jgi:hypothetical protein
MQILRGLNHLLQLVTGSEMYCLLSLAIRNHFKKPATAGSSSNASGKERAKAVNAE